MKMKVLVIEDEALILHFIEHRLKMEDFAVDIARDGKEAMKHISNNRYSLIISDLMIPFVSGFELISKIRSDVKNTATPILIVSALNSETTILDALSIGANDFLPKPFAINILMTKVKLWLREQNLQQAG